MVDQDRLRGTRPTVSVVVPVLNGERWLARTLESLFRQSVASDSYEVLVVDNGSTDRSREIATSFPRAIVLREDTKGSYAARNRGVRSASGAILAFTDADCVADASWLESILAAFEDPAVELICGLRRPASSSLPLSGAMDYETTKDQWVLGSGRPQIYYGYTCNLAVRRATFDAIGPFKPLLRGADTLFVREVAERHSCAVIRFVPGMAITHLEMGGLDAYFRKVGAYGFHRRLNNESGLPSRSLTFPERMSIFKETVRRHRYSMPRASLLFVTLCAGAAFWHAGALRARLKPAAPAPVTARSLREG